MEKSKLIALLRTLSTPEWRLFHDFVHSPYFNQHQDAIRLCEYLRKLAPDGLRGKAIERTIVHDKLFPGRTYDERSFNHLLSKLLKLGEQFLGQRQWESDGAQAEYYVLEALNRRRLEKSFEHRFRKARVELDAQPERDDRRHFYRYRLADLGFRRASRQQVRRNDPFLQEASDELQRFFLARQLKYFCAMLNRQRLLPVAYRPGLSSTLLQYLEDEREQQPPAVEVYRLASLLFQQTEEGDSLFKSFRDRLPETAGSFPPSEQRELYYLAVNFCTHQIRLGERRYADELFDLYREGLQQGILLEEGELSPWTYKNMIKLGLNLQKFDWVEHIIERYTHRLREEAREDAYHFNLADLYYHRQDYDQALTHLQRVEFSDIHYNLGAKAILLRIYYEQGETEAFLSLAAAFNIFLRRNKLVAKNIKAPYVNFIRLLLQVHKYGREKQAEIRCRIEQTKAVHSRSWLLSLVENVR